MLVSRHGGGALQQPPHEPGSCVWPPASGECDDKLQVAKDLLNLKGQLTEEAKARQQLLSLLFNVAGNRIHLSEVISADGATVSKAITFVDDLIHDGDPATDMLARARLRGTSTRASRSRRV